MKNIVFKHLLFALCLGSLLSFSSCDDNDTPPKTEEEQELITTLTIRFQPVNKGETVTVTWSDSDGDGGQAPVVEAITLKANTNYTATLTVLDESKSPAVDLTEEIKEEGDEHEFFFSPTDANVTFTKQDTDANGRPIGLTNTVVAGDPSTGTLRVVLKHQPGLKSAGSNETTGETDIDATFNVTIAQ